MRILALETSTELGSCALWHNGVMTERFCPAGQTHAETLLPLVRELLQEAALRVADLDAIAFGVGPGAFTGLRVACGAAQGLAMAGNTPLIPVTSLETLALQCGGEQVVALLDARMGEVYGASYRRTEAGYCLVGEIRLAAPADIALPTEAGWQACGNAARAYPQLDERLRAAAISSEYCLPGAAAVLRVALPRAERGEGIDAALAAPLYVRDKVAKTVAERLSEGGRA
ncbi:MAG: tRNA (adenosine(37)-N6)-threonylcarbamoyltransferase complex dimerization subunit type 1 TsaB [Rhodocyclales bacterium GT-UBC]|nr:MAG: tRNA (adenosine(37)-N6)-threonylcarbamoyltransferase complex dimerization subunit type 1 TsaB [Rhodocyclales bacterium GT-UBC]